MVAKKSNVQGDLLRGKALKARELRNTVGICGSGDLIELPGGRRFVVTAWLGGGPMGRMIDEDGDMGELEPLGGAWACVCLESGDQRR